MNTKVPFIDRENELTQIKQAVSQWGTRRIVFISGNGGIGKSRLLQEVAFRSPQPVSSNARAVPKEKTIALVQEFTESQWSQRFLEGVRDTACQIGIKLVETDADFDSEKMAADMNRVIEQSPDAIVVSLGTRASFQSGMRKAIESGIKVLTFDNYIQGVEGITCRITQDNIGGARSSLEQLARDIGFRGEIAIGYIEGFRPLEDRKNFFDVVLRQFPDISVVDELHTSGREIEQESYWETKRILKEHPHLKAIWATWDEFARGAVQALIEEQRMDIAVYSFDLCPDDNKLMFCENSPWKATVATDPYSCGQMCISLAALATCDEPIERHYTVPLKLITQDALRERLNGGDSLWKEFENQVATWLDDAKRCVPLLPELLVAEIIDFDDQRYHISQNIGREIAHMLGAIWFAPYLRSLANYRRMEEKGTSREQLEREETEIAQEFVKCFNNATRRRRVVLRFDTVEKVRETVVWTYLRNLAFDLKNVVIIFAGREMQELQEQFSQEIYQDSQFIDLSGLPIDASEDYLNTRRETLHITLSPDLVKKILLMADGRPILIDLAVGWLARDEPLLWLVQSSLDELSTSSPQERKQRESEFERRLVGNIAEMRKPLHWLILTMARVYPMDTGEISALLNLSESAAAALLNEAREYVFVKSLPDGRISLHDEMRRMVIEHVWSEIDRDGQRQRRDSRIASAFLNRRIQTLAEQIWRLKNEEETAKTQKDWVHADISFVHREVLEREMWVVQGQCLEHQLFADLEQGVLAFKALFDKATEDYELSFREVLANTIKPFAQQLPLEERYEVDSRRILYLTDAREYNRARRLAVDLHAQDTLVPEQQYRLLMQLGDIEARLNNYETAAELYRQAAEICRDSGLDHLRVQAEKGQGYAYRLQGNHDEAQNHYVQALKLALRLGDSSQQAVLYNNLAFLHTLRPVTQDKALQMSDNAIALWIELGNERMLGATYNTRATILYRFGRYHDALDYYGKALAIFTPQNDWEWLSVVYSWRGVTYWAMARFLDLSYEEVLEYRRWARQDLELACQHVLPRDQAMTFNRLARIYCDLGLYQGTADYANRSYESAKASKDRQYEIAALDMMAHLAILQGDVAALHDLEIKTRLYESKYPEEHQRHNVTLGRMYYHLGTLALMNSDAKKARAYYLDGFPLIARYAVYGWISLPETLRRFEETVLTTNRYDVVTSQFIRDLGTTLNALWDEKNLDITAPEVLATFARWQKWPNEE